MSKVLEHLEELQEDELHLIGDPSLLMERRYNYYKKKLARVRRKIPYPLPPIEEMDYVTFLQLWFKGNIKLPTKYEDPTFYHLLKIYTKQIIEGIKRSTNLNRSPNYNQFLEMPVTGSLFTSDINASAILVPPEYKEYLVVFNRDLFNFCNLFSKIVSMVTSISYKPDESLTIKENIHVHCIRIIENIEKRLEENPLIMERLYGILHSYTEEASIGMSMPFAPEQWYATEANLFTNSMEIFILSHEYSHIHSGHLEKGLRRKAFVANKRVIEIRSSHIKEIEADYGGLILMLGAINNKYYPPYSICGPTIFFHFLNIIDSFKFMDTTDKNNYFRLTSSTHPAPLTRLKKMRETVYENWGNSSWGETLLEPSKMIDVTVEKLMIKFSDYLNKSKKVDSLHGKE